MNKMSVSVLSIILALGISFGCKNDNTDKLISFSNNGNDHHLVGKKISTVEHSCIIDLGLIDSLLILNSRSNCYPSLYHIYSNPKFQYLNSIGHIGNGPDEYNEGRLCCVHDSLGIWTVDMNHKKLKLIDPVNGTIIKSILFPKESGMLGMNTFVNKQYIIGKSLSQSSNCYFKYDIQKDSLFANMSIPRLKYLVGEDKRNILYSGIIDFNSSTNKLIVAYDFFNQIDIFNIENGIKILSLKLSDDRKVADWRINYPTVVPPNAWHYYSDIVSTDSHIFALLNYHQMKERASPDSISSIILKLDWEGNLVSIYLLSDYIERFVYDEQRDLFIGLNQISDVISVYSKDNTE